MSDLIRDMVRQLGIETSTAEGAAGAVLGMIKQQAPQGALDGLIKNAPEASGWMDKAAPLLGSSVGGVAGLATGLLGGGGLGGLAQGAAALGSITTVLEKLGLSKDMAAKALPLVMGFVQNKMGAGGFEQLTSQVPFLKSIGGAGAGASIASALGGFFK